MAPKKIYDIIAVFDTGGMAALLKHWRGLHLRLGTVDNSIDTNRRYPEPRVVRDRDIGKFILVILLWQSSFGKLRRFRFTVK